MSNLLLRKAVIGLQALSVVAIIAGSAHTVADTYVPAPNINPNQPKIVGTFMANGVVDFNDSSYIAPTGEDFDRIIMGRDDQGIADRRAQAVEFFKTRFGIDFSNGDTAQDGKIGLFRSYLDPRFNYRAYKLGNKKIPNRGLVIHDSAFVMGVTDMEGAKFFGTWGGEEGKDVEFGTIAIDGEYLIQGTHIFKQGHPKNMYLHFTSDLPIPEGFFNDIKFNCRIENVNGKVGVALGRRDDVILNDGRTQVNINTVVQFPPPQWFTEVVEAE